MAQNMNQANIALLPAWKAAGNTGDLPEGWYGPGGSKSNPVGLQSDLNQFNNDTFAGGGGVQSLGQIKSDLTNSGLLPTGEAPTAPSLVKQYGDLSATKGVDAISASITDLKAQQDALAAQVRTNTSAERGKPVAQNVIEGRISVEQRNAQEQYDFIGRQLTRKNDELTSALTSIKTIMDLTQVDYQNASQQYSQKFDQAINTFNLIRGIQQDQKTEAQRAQDNARANLQIFTNAITEGNVKFSDLPPDQQANINKMEVQAGLPVGFTAALKEKIDPNANIISTTNNDGQIQVLLRQPDGTIGLQTYGQKNPTKGAAVDNKSLAVSSAAGDAQAGRKLSELFKAYTGILSGDEIYRIYNSNAKKPDTNSKAKPGTGYLQEYGVTLFK